MNQPWAIYSSTGNVRDLSGVSIINSQHVVIDGLESGAFTVIGVPEFGGFAANSDYIAVRNLSVE